VNCRLRERGSPALATSNWQLATEDTMAALKTQAGLCTKLQWTLGGVLAACIAAFLVLYWRPGLAEQEALRADISRRQLELDANRDVNTRLAVVTANVERTKLRLERFNRKLPRQEELGQFVKEITNLSQQASLRRLSNQPGDIRRRDVFSERPISLSFEGNFSDVFTFLRQAEEMQRLTRVRTLNVRSLDAQQGLVDVQVVLSIYFSEI
jgi:Tfp pilus assembly protein PilO